MKVKTLIQKLTEVDPDMEVIGYLCEQTDLKWFRIFLDEKDECYNHPLIECPDCGKVLGYNSWFHAYICNCGYTKSNNELFRSHGFELYTNEECEQEI